MTLTRAGFILLVLLISDNTLALELAAEKWSGNIIMPGSMEKGAASFHIKVDTTDDSPTNRITMMYGEHPYDFDELVITDNAMTFKLNTGSIYDCKLELNDDGAYQGHCTRLNKENVEKRIDILMQPPLDNGEEEEATVE